MLNKVKTFNDEVLSYLLAELQEGFHVRAQQHAEEVASLRKDLLQFKDLKAIQSLKEENACEQLAILGYRYDAATARWIK